MKKIVPYLLSSVLLLGAVACSGAQTSTDAPDTTGGTTELDKGDEKVNRDDASNPVRQKQIESDQRAIEQRNEAVPGNLTDNDLSSLVRNRLETALPGSQFLVEAKEGVVTVSGTARTEENLKQVDSLVKEVPGVKSVVVKATTEKSQ